MSRRDSSRSPAKRPSPKVAGLARALPKRMPGITVKEYEEPPMPPEQLERLEKLAEVVQDMEWGRAEDERERQHYEAMRKREVSSMRRRIQKEIRRSSNEVRERESEARDLRREVHNLEREEEALIRRKLVRDEQFEETFNKVKSKEMEKNLSRLQKRSETESAHEKLTHLKASMRTLEVNQIRAITDAERGARTRSSSRQTQLEYEVEELRRESERLDEENELLRRELESYKLGTIRWESSERPKNTVDSNGVDARAVIRTTATEKSSSGAQNQNLEASRRGVMSSPGRMASRQKESLDGSFRQQLGSSTASIASLSASAPAPAVVRTASPQAAVPATVLPATSLPGSAIAPSGAPVRVAVPTELATRAAELVAPSRLSTGMGTEPLVAQAPAFAWGTSLATASSRKSLEVSPSTLAATLPATAAVQSPARLSSFPTGATLRLGSPSSAFRSTSASPMTGSRAQGSGTSVAAPPRRGSGPTRVSTLSAAASESAIPVLRAVQGSVAAPIELRASPQRMVSPPARAPTAVMGTRASMSAPLQAAAAGPWLQPSMATPIRV